MFKKISILSTILCLCACSDLHHDNSGTTDFKTGTVIGQASGFFQIENHTQFDTSYPFQVSFTYADKHIRHYEIDKPQKGLDHITTAKSPQGSQECGFQACELREYLKGTITKQAYENAIENGITFSLKTKNGETDNVFIPSFNILQDQKRYEIWKNKALINGNINKDRPLLD